MKKLSTPQQASKQTRMRQRNGKNERMKQEGEEKRESEWGRD